MMDHVRENDKDNDGNENKPRDNHLGQKDASLLDAESINFAMGVPGQRGIEATPERNRREERQNRKNRNDKEKLPTARLSLLREPCLRLFGEIKEATLKVSVIHRVAKLASGHGLQRLVGGFLCGKAAMASVPGVQARGRLEDSVRGSIRMIDGRDGHVRPVDGADRRTRIRLWHHSHCGVLVS